MNIFHSQHCNSSVSAVFVDCAAGVAVGWEVANCGCGQMMMERSEKTSLWRNIPGIGSSLLV